MCIIFKFYRGLSFARVRKCLGIILLSIFFYSCNNHPGQKQNEQKLPFDAIGITPRADTVKPARVVVIDTCRKAPQVIAIPVRPSTLIIETKKGKDTLHVTPPVQKKADFYMPMTTYTADQGLYSAISSIKRDKAGNLWFGTYGGGVSRYDGKSFTTYTTAQGLANNVVFSVAEDKTGNLWFGTSGGGVSRYDGKSFTTYTTAQGLADNSVWSITEDKTGNLWFGTDGGGVSRYDGKSFTTYTTAQGLANNNIRSIVEDKSGNLWFGTYGGGVSRYDPSASSRTGVPSFTTYTTTQGLANNNIKSIAEDKSGNLWFGTSGGGVSRYDPSASLRTGSPSFTTYTTAQGLANNVVLSIAEDKTGNLWFGTDGGGVSRYDPSASPGTGPPSFTTYTTAQGLANNAVVSIADDKTGNLWFGTSGGGVSRYDGKSFTTYTTAQGLANNSVWSITEDKTGNLWFGTYGGGVSRYDPSASLRTGLPSFTTYTTAQGLANNVVFSIAEDKTGNLWFGTYGGGVSRYDPSVSPRTGLPSFTTYTTAQGLANNVVLSIAGDKTGNLWFGTDGGGVSRYDGKSFTTYTTAQGLANNVVFCIAEDKTGNLWFGTYGGGVSRYDPSASLRTGPPSFTTYTTAQGLANNFVESIAEDKTGNLWFGTSSGGVSRYDGKSFITYTTAQGLANNAVASIAEDKAGNLWFGTNEGFSVLKCFTMAGTMKPDAVPDDRQEKNDNPNTVGADNNLSNVKIIENYTPVFEKYNFRNGYPVKDVNTNAMHIDSKGIIWAGTGDKLVRFDYSGIYKDTAPPSVFINTIKIGGGSICWNDLKPERSVESGELMREDSMAIINEEVGTFGSVLTAASRDSMRQRFSGIEFDSITRFYPIPVDLVLPYRHNNISFDFGASEPARPYLVNYQYMLEGYDKDWNPVTNRSTATFGNIHEGSYTFKLKAQSPDGVWSEPLTYTFTVLPPIYRTWWAFLIYILAGIYTIYGIIHRRTAIVRKEKEHLEKMVAERTAQVVKEKAEVERKNVEIEKQKQRSDELLLNILPEEVAAELKYHGSSAARYYDNVTVLFTDFENFTQASEHMSPQALIDELHTCFKTFDEITDKYNIEKIKTIGDAYMAVAGLPTADPKHAENVVRAAIEITAFMTNRYKQIGDKTFTLRIGIHSGNVVAGIVGVKKFAYDIWGDTVNTAARMEQNSEAGKINISQTTYELVKDKFTCTYRGELEAKNKGKMSMYFVS